MIYIPFTFVEEIWKLDLNKSDVKHIIKRN